MSMTREGLRNTLYKKFQADFSFPIIAASRTANCKLASSKVLAALYHGGWDSKGFDSVKGIYDRVYQSSSLLNNGSCTPMCRSAWMAQWRWYNLAFHSMPLATFASSLRKREASA